MYTEFELQNIYLVKFFMHNSITTSKISFESSFDEQKMKTMNKLLAIKNQSKLELFRMQDIET